MLKINQQFNTYYKDHKIHIKELRRHPARRYKEAIYYARRREQPFLLTKADYIFFASQSCFYCNRSFKTSSIGLDRKRNDKGYQLDNVVSCCGSCNKMKSDVLTFDEAIFLSYMRKVYSGELSIVGGEDCGES